MCWSDTWATVQGVLCVHFHVCMCPFTSNNAVLNVRSVFSSIFSDWDRADTCHAIVIVYHLWSVNIFQSPDHSYCIQL